MTTIGFFCRARAFFVAYGIERLHRVGTDNGANYRAKDLTRCVEALAGRHLRIKAYTPCHNGKVERYNRLLADEVLYVRPYDRERARREAIGVWVNHFNHHRPHTACGDQPAASRVPARANNVIPSYSSVERCNRLPAREVFYVRPYASEQTRRDAIAGLGEPLHLPSAAYLLWRSAPGLAHPGLRQ